MAQPSFIELPDGRYVEVPEGTDPMEFAQQVKAKMAPSEFGRSVAQGLTFGFSDEIEAAVRSALPESIGGGEYSKIRDELRSRLADYKEANPGTALTAEVAGAIIPSIVATIATGGAAGPASLGRLAAIGAGQGGLYALGTSDKDSVGGTVSDVAVGAGLGAVANPAVAGVGRGIAKVGGKFVDFVRGKLGERASDAVQAELRRLQQQTGKSVDEIVDDLANGRLMSENQTLFAALKNYVTEGGASGSQVLSGIRGRARETREEAMGELQGRLAPAADDNVVQAQRAQQAARKSEAREGYSQAFDDIPTNDVSESIAGTMLGAVQRVPEAAVALQRVYRAQNLVPLITVGDDGAIAFARTPTLRDAEIVRRALDAQKQSVFREGGGGGLGEAIGDLEKSLRTQIDEFSPQLAETRKGYAALKSRDDAFDAGRKALTTNVDELELFIDGIRGNAEMTQAFRQGVMDSIRNKVRRTSTTLANLANEDKQFGQAIRTVFDGEDIASIERKMQLAGEVGEMAGKMPSVAGSATAPLQREASRSGTGFNLTDALALGGPDAGLVTAAQRLSRLFERNAPNLSDAERQRVVGVLFSRDPEIVKKALSDQTALEMLEQKYGKMIQATGAGLRTGAVMQASQETSPIR